MFEKSYMVIQIMGEQGISLRPTVVKEVTNNLSLAKVLMNMGESPALVEQIQMDDEQGASAGGNQPTVLRLRETGEQAYQLLNGKLPVENEYDGKDKHHASCRHTILNQQGISVLNEERNKIVRNPKRINLLRWSPIYS